ncbi:PREDICTED: coiled-coil domain-containing protein 183 isoform X2 [Ficedula albicollis]|uniref:coiled-coil domain-containing protein 183 isoform X2 n=1 Tax=Ficedula albicollis TaxID=59894 RepID=UPI0003599C1E|nr:PREDICTED: coiled-coil domain-containing protein 183 isoform X2 [Ficedula albicollis]
MVGPGMEAPGSERGPKAKLSQRSQELRALVGLQEQGGKVFAQSCEEKLRQNRELLPSLQAALQEDSSVLKFVLKYNKLPIKDAFGEGQELFSATESLEVVIKKIEAKVHEQVKVCDMLLHQLRQWSQARDERQRHLQELQEAEVDPKWQEPQLQTIRQLGNDIEKMLMKIHSGEMVTNLYLRLQEVLRRELVYLPRYLDLLCGMTVMYHEELRARSSLKANNAIKKLMAEAGPQVRAEKQLRDQSLAEQRKHIESLRRQEESERQQRQQAVSMLSEEQDLSSSDVLVGADVEAAKAKMQREAFVTDKMEKAKSALQCSRLWDIPSSIEAQRRSLGSLQQHIDECKERKTELKKTLEELELQQAKLKFNEPVSTTRLREEELRQNLQQEEARLEQMRAQMSKSQKRLIEFENIIDNLYLLLQGILIPGQDSAAVVGLEEKLQECEKKLQFLKERLAARPEDSTDEHGETFAKVRTLLEKRTAEETRNLKISFEDEEAMEDDTLDFEDEDHDYIPSREDIKKQGLQLIRMNTRRRKKKQ